MQKIRQESYRSVPFPLNDVKRARALQAVSSRKFYNSFSVSILLFPRAAQTLAPTVFFPIAAGQRAIKRAAPTLPRRERCATIRSMYETETTYLLQNRMKNIDMLELLKIPAIRSHYAGADGVLIERDGLFALSAEPDTGGKFLPMLAALLPAGKPCLAILHSPELVGPLKRDYGFTTVMDCLHGVYDRGVPIPFTLPAGAAIRRLDESHADFVHENYRTVDDVGYVRERISEGMFGAFFGGACAGFIGTHDERSIGLLHILPKYRRLGLAFALEAVMTNHLLAEGRQPFCQVALGNEPSFALQRKLGFAISEDVINWLERE